MSQRYDFIGTVAGSGVRLEGRVSVDLSIFPEFPARGVFKCGSEQAFERLVESSAPNGRLEINGCQVPVVFTLENSDPEELDAAFKITDNDAVSRLSRALE